jgi:hypothetical protein
MEWYSKGQKWMTEMCTFGHGIDPGTSLEEFKEAYDAFMDFFHEPELKRMQEVDPVQFQEVMAVPQEHRFNFLKGATDWLTAQVTHDFMTYLSDKEDDENATISSQ